MRRNRIARTLTLASVLLFWHLGCGDLGPVGLPDPSALSIPPQYAISDAVHSGGNEHFFWLPPMVGDPGVFNGDFDGTKEPTVTIEDLAAAPGAVVAEFTFLSGPGSETVRVVPADEHYIVNWHTDQFPVEPGPTYRITVAVAGTELGFADVQLGSNQAEVRNLSTEETLGLLDGRTLPISFRIEEGAIFVVSPTEDQTVEALQGEVTLEIPAGALTEETGITVELAEPVDEAITAVTFGPEGLQFEEPVPVTLAYDEAALGDVEEEDLALNLLYGEPGTERWVILPGGSVDPITNTVTAPFHHFSTGGVGPAELALWCPGDADPVTFESITEALDAVMEGGTVEVCDGTHTVQEVMIPKAMTIEGALGVRPTITTGGARHGFRSAVPAGILTIRNLRLETDWADPSLASFASVLTIQHPYDQVVVEDVDVEVLPGPGGERHASGILIDNTTTPGAHVLIQNVAGVNGRRGVTLWGTSTHADGAISAEIRSSSLGGNESAFFVRNDADPGGITVLIEGANVSNSDQGVRVSEISEGGFIVANVNDLTFQDPTGAVGVFGQNQAPGPGPEINVTNSSFEGAAVWLQTGASGLIQGNIFNGCHFRACVRVHSFEPGHERVQVTPPRVIGNQFNLSGPGETQFGVYLTQPTAGPYEIRDNSMGGVVPGGDRNDPNSYAFYGSGIHVGLAAAPGTISGNTISSAYDGISVDSGTEAATGQDNVIDAVHVGLRVVNTGGLSVHSSDVTDYGLALSGSVPHYSGSGADGSFAAGDATCNWWGSVDGPQAVGPGVTSDAFSPFATGPIANGAGGACDGVSVGAVTVEPGYTGSDPATFATLAEAFTVVTTGGTVTLAAGTHFVDALEIPRGMTLQGAPGTRPTVTTGGARHGLLTAVPAGAVTIRNLRLETNWIDPSGSSFASVLTIQDPYDQVVVEDVDVEVLPGPGGERHGSGILVNNSTIPGAHVSLRNVTVAAARRGISLWGVGAVPDGNLDAEIRDSNFSGTQSGFYIVNAADPGSINALVDNVTVSDSDRGVEVGEFSENGSVTVNVNSLTFPEPNGTLGVYGYNAAPGPGPEVNVSNSTFDRAAVWLQGGASGLIQGNNFNACHFRACVRIRTGNLEDGQVESVPARVIGNSFNMTGLGETQYGVFLTALATGPFEIRDNFMGGVTPGGDRSDPYSYAFNGDGIMVMDPTAAGEITGNLITSADHGITVLRGTAGSTGSDNVLDGVRVGFRVLEGGALSVQNSDITDHIQGAGNAVSDYLEPSAPGTFNPGDLTCNWWGSPSGPSGVGPGVPIDAYEPWATGPVAHGAGGACDGVAISEVTVEPGYSGADPATFATLVEALATVAPGGTVNLAEGTHFIDGLEIPKSVTIQAAAGAASRPILETTSPAFGLGIWQGKAWNVTVRGVQLQGASNQLIYISHNTGDILIDDVHFYPGPQDFSTGVDLYETHATSVVIQNSEFRGGGRGITASSFGNPNISALNNVFEGQREFVVEGKFTEFSNNTLLTCVDACVNFNAQFGATVVRNNTVTVDPNHPDQPAGVGTVFWAADLTTFTFEGNTVQGVSTEELPYPIQGQVIFLHGVNDGVLNNNTIGGVQDFFYAFTDVGTVTGSDNVMTSHYRVFYDEIDDGTVYSLSNNDFDSPQYPYQGADGNAAGSMTCNWWGSAAGPTAGAEPDFDAPSDSYTPWATGPIANGAGGACDGGLRP